MIPLISIASGLLFGIVGIGHKIGSFGKVFPIQVVSALASFGMFFFGILGRDAWAMMPWYAYLIGAVCGLTQYSAIRLLRKALELGPLSPAWCAASLSFMPAVIYAAIALGESLSLMQYGAVLATILAIVSSATGQHGGAGEDSYHEAESGLRGFAGHDSWLCQCYQYFAQGDNRDGRFATRRDVAG